MVQMVREHGPLWSVVARQLPTRTGRQVRNYDTFLV
jgi:hypothetical protein